MARSSGELLGIYYINGILSAEVIRHGKSVRGWQNLFPVIEEEKLGELLNTIPEQMKFKGYQVSMIIAAPSIEYQILPVPLMKKKDLKEFCRWKAEALKGKDHVWAYTVMKSVLQKKGNICLHLVPAVYQTMFLDFCKKKRLEPQHLLTLPAVMPELLEKSEDGKNGVEMVALATDRITYFVVGTRGAPLFIREIPYLWGSQDRNNYMQFGREIKRTMLFGQKQFHKSVTSVRIRGPEVAKAGDAFQEIDTVRPEIDATDVSLFEYISSTTCYRSDNLLPFDMLGSRGRVMRTMVIAVLLLMFIGGMLSMTLLSSLLFRKTSQMLAESNVENEALILADSIAAVQAKLNRIEANRLTGRYIADNTGKPVPGWIMTCLADILPDTLQLSRVYIERNPSVRTWSVDIEGTGPSDPLSAAELLEGFEESLKVPPLRFSVVQTWKVQWLDNLRNGGGADDDAYTRRFRIKGIVR